MDENRIEKLEMNLVYMQDTINSLNKIVVEQTMEIDRLKKGLEILSKRLEEVEEGEDRPNRKPPHY